MAADNTVRINVWSGPRSLSTTLMYSFAQHPEVTALDEPLYAHHLRLNPHLQRPYRDEVMKAQNPDGEQVVKELLLGPCPTRVLYAKHIAKQWMGLGDDLLKQTLNIILVRNPVDALASWEEKLPVTLEESSYPQLLSLWTRLRELGQEPLVIDAEILQRDPEGVLRTVCSRAGMDFTPAMLSWPAGPKKCDGLWASFWYGNVHKSTGFQSSSSARQFPTGAAHLLDAAFPIYQALRRHAIGAHISPSKLGPGAIVAAPQQPVLPDERNRTALAWVGAGLVPRACATMSVFDSSVQGGDAVWEGVRVYAGKVLHVEEHVSRMLDSAKAMAFADVPSRAFIKNAIYRTLKANGMDDNVHMRVTLSRGEKITSSMNPMFNQYGSRLVVLAEWKPSAGIYNNTAGVALVTACTRRNPPSCVDSKIHHCNLINNILAKIQANVAGVADAIMLDLDGFVAETNATNLFCVRRGELLTPHADHCLPGITRATILKLATKIGLKVCERRVSLSEFHSADEVFTTGTMGELTPVVTIDGRAIGAGQPGPVTAQLQAAYREHALEVAVPIDSLADSS